jgi:hypothetical protein
VSVLGIAWRGGYPTDQMTLRNGRKRIEVARAIIQCRNVAIVLAAYR